MTPAQRQVSLVTIWVSIYVVESKPPADLKLRRLFAPTLHVVSQPVSSDIHAAPWAADSEVLVQLDLGIALTFCTRRANMRRTGIAWNKKHFAAA